MAHKSSTEMSGLLVIPSRSNINSDVVGTEGRPIDLQVNHLALSLRKPNMIAIHYDVSFFPETPKKLYRAAMAEVQKKCYPNNFPAFDGRKNLYSAGPLPIRNEIRTTVKVLDNGRSYKEFKVAIKIASKVDMSQMITYMNRGTSMNLPQEALQAIDVVLRNPSANQFISVGRSFFSPPEARIVDLGDGMELWHGFYQSAILGWKPFLNVDVAHKGFPKAETVLEVICRICRCNERDLQCGHDLPRPKLFELEKYLKGLKVEYQIPHQNNTKRTYRVNKVLNNAMCERFNMVEDSRSITLTVGEYFEKYKNYRLKYPNMPCIHIGSTKKNIYIPSELLRIVQGQDVKRKMTELQTATMIKNTAQPAGLRKKRIMDSIRIARFNEDPCVKEFGLHVAKDFTEITGRILDPPTLRYNNLSVTPRRGIWKTEKFLVGQEIDKWVVLNCEQRLRTDLIRTFIEELSTHGKALGVNILSRPDVRSLSNRTVSKYDFEEVFQRSKEDRAQLIIVILPDHGDTYALVKQAAELNVGVLTQCIKSKTLNKLSPSTVCHILQKINCKLNGINHCLTEKRPSVLNRPCMIVGADVTHPSPDQTFIPSVAAVAASHDANAFCYNMQWRLQPPRTEIIQDLENIMTEQLKYFYRKTKGCKPESILFYRDGVSEGQFAQVLNKELVAIRRACTGVEVDYKPKITFLVVQKRHHTRFFPTRREDEDGKYGNVPAGTIVDTTITHPTELDFYLVSHPTVQGTAKPTKYHLLWDDNKIKENDLEELTYHLCHLFSRCTSSVSYPAPTYYAHLAAFRARVYLEGSKINLANLQNESNQKKIKTDVQKKLPMFFV